jgi:hypothetical protein
MQQARDQRLIRQALRERALLDCLQILVRQANVQPPVFLEGRLCVAREASPFALTAASRNLSINDITTYANAIVPTTVPKTVPARPRNRARSSAGPSSGAITRMQRSFMERKISQGWPRVLSSLKSLLETGRPLQTWAGR